MKTEEASERNSYFLWTEKIRERPFKQRTNITCITESGWKIKYEAPTFLREFLIEPSKLVTLNKGTNRTEMPTNEDWYVHPQPRVCTTMLKEFLDYNSKYAVLPEEVSEMLQWNKEDIVSMLKMMVNWGTIAKRNINGRVYYFSTLALNGGQH